MATFATYGAFASLLYLLAILGSGSAFGGGWVPLALVSAVADFGVVLLLAMRPAISSGERPRRGALGRY